MHTSKFSLSGNRPTCTLLQKKPPCSGTRRCRPWHLEPILACLQRCKGNHGVCIPVSLWQFSVHDVRRGKVTGSTAGGRKPYTLPVSFHQKKADQMLQSYYHHNMTPHRPGIKQRGATRRAAEGAVDDRQRLHGQGARGAGQRNSVTEGQVREEQLHHICLKRGLLLGRDGVQLGADIGAEMAAACATVILLSSKIRQNCLRHSIPHKTGQQVAPA